MFHDFDEVFGLDGIDRGIVQLPEVEVVGLESAETGFEIVAELVGGPDVGDVVLGAGGRDGAAALGGQVIIVATAADVAADELLAEAVVVGGIDEVDAGIKDGVEDDFGLVGFDRPAAPYTRASKSPWNRNRGR